MLNESGFILTAVFWLYVSLGAERYGAGDASRNPKCPTPAGAWSQQPLLLPPRRAGW